MPLGTLDRSPPPLFRQGTSALTKLLVLSSAAIFLMVADARFQMIQPVRTVLATAIYPMQALMLQPRLWTERVAELLRSVSQDKSSMDKAQLELASQAQRVQQVEQLQLENARLRQLLELREPLASPSLAAQVIYDAADPYSRKVVIDKGTLKGVVAGAPVIDDLGVLGQVTRVYPLTSEVTLLTDPEQFIPTLNTRNGLRALASGSASRSNGMELRLIPASADVQVGDLLTTSGVDAVFPAGLMVARVTKVERRVDSSFAAIELDPMARADGALHVLVLEPATKTLPARPNALSNPKPGQSASGGRE